MNKTDLIAFVAAHKGEHEDFYVNNGPDKHEQEDAYTTGVSVVNMNVGLFQDWLSDHEAEYAAYEAMPKADRRAVWEASDFHFGIYGYEAHDAEFYWQHEEAD